jgi:hypothetical protein
MIAFRRLVLPCVALLACGSAGGSAIEAAARDQAPDIFASVRREPMIFFVAKGTPNACGPGCGEWIAAEGRIDPQAAQRLGDFIGALQRRDLPIFFNSAGGIVGQAMAIGAILREHRITAGVGRTMPEGCRYTIAIGDACREVMQSQREHKARLVTDGARCASSCIYALIGGSIRQVARGAQLGIHSARFRPLDGRSPEDTRYRADQINNVLKRYVIEMGVDPGLVDAAAKVSADRIHQMSRDGIV